MSTIITVLFLSTASANVAAAHVTTPWEDWLRERLQPCVFGGGPIPPEEIYEPELAAMARRVDALAPDTHPEYSDHAIRDCGSAPERPVNGVQTVKSIGNRVTVMASTGTDAMNNREQRIYTLVDAGGIRIYDAIFGKTTLRALLAKRLQALNAIEAEKSAAAEFVRAKSGSSDAKAGLQQAHRTHVTATLADGSTQHYIVESTPHGPRVWDTFENGTSGRFASADKAFIAGVLPLTDAEAVAFVRAELQRYVKPSKKSKDPIAAPLSVLMEIDGQLTDGVPYVNGDIVCGCQDYAGFSIESVAVKSRDGAMVRVTADFRVFGDAQSARHQAYVVAKTKQGLFIYDVIDAEGSLRDQLQKVVAEDYTR